MLSLSEPKFQFDRNKFKEVVHFIVSISDPCELTKVKLHKALYFSDVFSFLEKSQPITGVDYVKQKFGPTARHLAWALRELENEGSLESYDEEFYGYIARRFKNKTDCRATSISDDEKNIIRHFTQFVCGKTASEISDLSHNAAWHSVGIGEAIPYHRAIRILPAEVDDEDMDWAETTITEYVQAT